MDFNDVQRFADTHLATLETKDRQSLHMALLKLHRYRAMLGIIQSRFLEADRVMLRTMEEFREQVASMTGEQRLALCDRLELHGIALHLEIESFYMFAKNLLDHVARTFKLFFGELRGIKLKSHHDLSTAVPHYERERQLVLNGFTEDVERLQKDIVEFRDKQIVHEGCARTMYRTSWVNGQQARMELSRINPKPTDDDKVSGDVQELLAHIDVFLGMFLALIATNLDRTVLKRE